MGERPVSLAAAVHTCERKTGPRLGGLFQHPIRRLTGLYRLWQTRPMSHGRQEDVNQALAALGLTLPATPEALDRAKRVQLYTWNPARYSNLTNNPKKYMQAYKKAEEMTKLIEASYTLLTAVLVPEEGPPGQSPS